MAAGLIARVFGFIYRIYLSDLTGAEGMGLYQLIAPVYTAVVLTITSGITIAVSKMTAEQKAKGNAAASGRIVACALAIVTAAGAAVSLVILFNANFISIRVLGDGRTQSALLILVPCIPAVVAASALKGYFYGVEQVTPTAFSQLAELAVKISVLFFFAGGIIKNGAGFACTVATLSTALGEIADLIVLVIIYLFKKTGVAGFGQSTKLPRKRKIVGELFKTAMPVCANRLIISTLSAAEYIMIPAMLIVAGLDDKSGMEAFGRLTGMALPLIMFPSLFTNPVATTLVPAISASVSLKNYKAVNYRISKSIQGTFIIGILFSALFICYPDEIGALVYKREKIGDMLFMLSFSCIFVYLQQILTGILNGLGKQGVLLKNTIIGSALRIASVWFLIPVYGVKGYIFGFTTSLFVAECMNLLAINRITGLIFDLREWLLKPGLIGAVMVITGKCAHYYLKTLSIGPSVATLLALAINAMIAGLLMILGGVVKPNELLTMAGFERHRKTKEY